MFYKVQLNFSETDLPNISVLAIGKKDSEGSESEWSDY